MADLKPCPHCGGKPELDDYRDKPVGAWVLSHKTNCILRIVNSYPTREAAIAAWNRRAPDPRDEVIRGLVEAGSALLHEAHFSMLGGRGHLLDDMDAALAAARKLMGADNG